MSLDPGLCCCARVQNFTPRIHVLDSDFHGHHSPGPSQDCGSKAAVHIANATRRRCFSVDVGIVRPSLTALPPRGAVATTAAPDFEVLLRNQDTSAHWRAAAGDAEAAAVKVVSAKLLPMAAHPGTPCSGDGEQSPLWRDFTSLETTLPPTALVEGWGGAEVQIAAGMLREDRHKRFKALLLHGSQPLLPLPLPPPPPQPEADVMRRE
jgi:hypothetical protein